MGTGISLHIIKKWCVAVKPVKQNGNDDSDGDSNSGGNNDGNCDGNINGNGNNNGNCDGDVDVDGNGDRDGNSGGGSHRDGNGNIKDDNKGDGYVVPMEITFIDTEDEYQKYGTLRSLRYIYSNPFRFPISSLGLPNFPSQKS